MISLAPIPPYPNLVSHTLHIGGQPCRIHGLSTGSVAIKVGLAHTERHNLLGRLSFLWNNQFTPFVPIWVWVIEHPTAGTFLVDTGERSAVNDPDYFHSSGWFNRWLYANHFRFQVERRAEVDQLLPLVGLSPKAIDTVLLTHLHLDHTDGLHHFPEQPILIHALEWQRPMGHLPKLFPPHFAPQQVVLDEALGPFTHTKAIAPQLWMVKTGGHTHGHASFLLQTDEGHVLFAGDVVYDQAQLEQDHYAGSTVDFKAAQKSYAQIRAFAQQQPTLVLPSHDQAAAERLVERRFFQPSA